MHPYKNVPKPTIPFGGAMPGRMAERNGQVIWEGEICWETVHGPASALWVAGCVAGIYGAAIPAGREAELKPGMPETTIWRRTGRDGSLVHGTVELLADDIRFTDSALQPAPGKWAHGSLPANLLASPEARGAVKDKSLAVDLYGSLCSIAWMSRSTGREYMGGWGRAADIVAQMRFKGEILADFYLNGNEGYVSEKAADLLDSLGWDLVGATESSEDTMKKAVRLVEVCEERPRGPMPAWYVHWIAGLNGGDSLDSRMHRAAFAGKVPYQEWIKFWEFFDIE